MIAGLLLAAGNSRRFGSDKLQQRLGGGRHIAAAAAQNLRAAVGYCIAVVPAEDQELKRLFNAQGMHVVHAPRNDIGIGTSLACGVRALPPVNGFVVALADMPFIQPSTIRRVTQALDAGASIAAPHYRGQRGHPIGFNACWRDALQNLSGDVGARALLPQHAHAIVPIDCGDYGVVIDIDEPDDLRRFMDYDRNAVAL